MSVEVQYVIVFLLAVAALWVSWRKLRGRNVFGSGGKADDCANCGSAGEHHRH